MLPGQAGVCASAEPHGAWGPQGQLPSFEPWIANAVPAMQQKDKGERCSVLRGCPPTSGAGSAEAAGTYSSVSPHLIKGEGLHVALFQICLPTKACTNEPSSLQGWHMKRYVGLAS
eukprot:scaffold106874_cov19-Tisochrysis_lutea.AAC.3